MAVSKRLRFEILRRDGFRCRYCGLTATATELRVDHVIPEALGGSDDPDNLTTACEPCNSGKTSIPLDAPLIAEVAADAERWARAIQLIAEDRRCERNRRFGQAAEFNEIWTRWTYSDGKAVERPADWSNSVDRFLGQGLDVGDLDELVTVAMSAKTKDAWKYFCGCCWTRIRESHAIARLLLEDISETHQEAHSGA